MLCPYLCTLFLFYDSCSSHRYFTCGTNIVSHSIKPFWSVFASLPIEFTIYLYRTALHLDFVLFLLYLYWAVMLKSAKVRAPWCKIICCFDFSISALHKNSVLKNALILWRVRSNTASFNCSGFRHKSNRRFHVQGHSSQYPIPQCNSISCSNVILSSLIFVKILFQHFIKHLDIKSSLT